MEITVNRLLTIWTRLGRSNLVQTKKPTDTNIADFLKDLNMAAPVTDFEVGAGELIRYLYRTDRGTFFRYIRIASFTHLVLMTDGGPIVSELGLTDIVIIRWNRVKKEFTVIACESTSMSSALETVNESGATNLPKGARGNRPPRKFQPRQGVNSTHHTEGKSEKQRYSSGKSERIPSVPPLSSEQYTSILNSAQSERKPSTRRTYANAAESLAPSNVEGTTENLTSSMLDSHHRTSSGVQNAVENVKDVISKTDAPYRPFDPSVSWADETD